MKSDKEFYILDTSALMTLIEDEEGCASVTELIQRAHQNEITLAISIISLMEVYYITLQERDELEAQERIRLLCHTPFYIFQSSLELALIAGNIKAKHKLSFADAWIAALAKNQNGILVHKDPEFESLKSEIKFLTLPYKK